MARGPFLAGLVRRTGVSGCVGRDRALKTSVPGRQSQGRQGYSQSIHSRPEHTPETMLSSTRTTRRVSLSPVSCLDVRGGGWRKQGKRRRRNEGTA